MKLRSTFATAFIALSSVLAIASVASAAPFGDFGNMRSPLASSITSRCATETPTDFQMQAVATALGRYVQENGALATGNIKVAWHVITSPSGEGNIPQSQIDAQIAYMNQRFAGTGFTFSLSSVDRTASRKWFTMTPGGNETNAKNALAIDPLHRFNVYTCKPGQNLLGWATFPWSYAESSKLHGVVFHYGSVPGGYLAPYNLGGTLAHEAGHYLGLYHTFQGGCTSPGDQIDDTPFEASAAYGCPNGRDTCTQPGLDPINNYMDYTDDACYTNFTANQTTRMQTQTGQYRPNLLNAAIAQAGNKPAAEEASLATGRMVFRNAFPNPFSTSTMLRFALPRDGHVAVKVYNVAGQLVQTLADGDMSAGEHSIEFAPHNLAAGTYFVQVLHGRDVAKRTVVFIR